MISEIFTPMETFLRQVSIDLYAKYGADISKLCLVFPNQRARLFFFEELSKLITQPLWMPCALSISDLIFEWAGRRPSDPLRLITELYKVYQGDIDFDTFFHRGEMVLNDFDQVDKYLVPAEALFQNLRDFKMLEGDYTFLSPEQISSIRQFWSSFSPQKSDLQESFTQMWALLSSLYSRFKETLLSKGLAYEGMLFREVAEGEIPFSLDPEIIEYVFIGFNALNLCEQKIFNRLQALGLARFYWDYDNYYVDDERQEAGLFLRKNIKEFPPETASFLSFSHFSLPKEIESWTIPSDVLQAKVVPQIIRNSHFHTDKRTAVVLCDESLLIPFLSAIPSLNTEVNVTMGYPLVKTSFYSFTETLLMLYHSKGKQDESRAYYHVDVSRLLNHPFTSYLCLFEANKLKEKMVKENILYVIADDVDSNGRLKRLLSFPSTPDKWLAAFSELLEEIEEVMHQAGNDTGHQTFCLDPFLVPVVRLAIKEVNKFRYTIQMCGIEISISLMFSLLRKTFQKISVPFSGEPLQGIQVMGILETRTLDFENVIFLSAQEGLLPSSSEMPSLIPYTLRAGFGLPVQQEREAMYAYYFYRLIQRAKKVSFLYSAGGDGVHSGEKSRYLLQIEAESPHKVVHRTLSLPMIFPPPAPKIIINKQGLYQERLLQFLQPDTQKPITPSAINAFLQCPLRFCYQYIEQIKEERNVEEDADGKSAGTILHSVMELLYSPLINTVVTAQSLRRLLEVKGGIRNRVEEVIKNEVGGIRCSKRLFEQGRWVILADIMTEYVIQIIKYDIQKTPFWLRAIERWIKKSILFSPQQIVPLGGILDRIDEKEGISYVIDYKTGNNQRYFSSLEALFDHEHQLQNSAVFQTFWYAMLLKEESPHQQVVPMLYYIRSLFCPDASSLLFDKSTKQEVLDVSPYLAKFKSLLGQKIKNLFDFSQPFIQTDDIKHCTYCSFNKICQRK